MVNQNRLPVEDKISPLGKLVDDWLQLDKEIADLKAGDYGQAVILTKRAQQISIVKRINEEASTIPVLQIPPDVEKFIALHAQ